MEKLTPTFAEQDRMRAERETKKREVIERLAKILAKEFSLNELKFIWNIPSNAVLIEAFEIARTKARG